MKTLDWHGCYSSNLKGIIADASFAHPAKFAYGLICRIYAHLLKKGWLREGDLVADPFAGVSVGGIVAAANGLRWLGVELEEKFVQLSQDNFELHRAEWDKMGKPMPVCMQGDSRNLASLVQEAARAIVCSPPYIDSAVESSIQSQAANPKVDITKASKSAGYGVTEGQIGAMKEGKLDEVVTGIITSPPFSDVISRDRADEPHAQSKVDYKWGGLSQYEVYGQSKGQLGGMPEGDHTEVMAIISSPPYSSSMSSEKSGIDWAKCKQENDSPRDMTQEPFHAMRIGAGSEMRYSPNPANMGNLSEGSHEAVVNGILTSPPFETTDQRGAEREYAWERQTGKPFGAGKSMRGYPDSEGQIGQEQAETYWHSVAQVYSECLKALKPGGVMAVVVKAFVRNKKIVNLPSQTLELLEAIGFEPLERIRAWLTSPVTQKSLMPELVGDYTKARKSFFRRLAERKGSPKIDFEVVLIVRKP